MCEFKIVKKNDGSQISEEIVILNYSDNNELLFHDILGMTAKIDSGLIVEVDTLNQRTVIFEHPIISNFIGLMKNIAEGKTSLNKEIELIQSQLEVLKQQL